MNSEIVTLKLMAVSCAMVFLTSGLSFSRVEAEPLKAVVAESEKVPKVVIQEQEAVNDMEDQTATMAVTAEDVYRLAAIAMAEAEGEDTEGKALVIRVVLNRVASDGFPNTIREVIMEQHSGVYQFSTVKDGGRWWTTEPDDDCYKAVEMVATGWDESKGALFFESESESSWLQQNLEFLFKHGGHYFYK